MCGHFKILTATKCCIKWVEIIALGRANEATITNFFRDNVIRYYGIPKHLFSGVGTSFFNKHVILLDYYDIDHMKPSSYYPHGMVKQKLPKILGFVFSAEWSTRTKR